MFRNQRDVDRWYGLDPNTGLPNTPLTRKPNMPNSFKCKICGEHVYRAPDSDDRCDDCIRRAERESNPQYQEGKQAAKDGKHWTDSPYKSDTEEHDYWREGWESSKYAF